MRFFVRSVVDLDRLGPGVVMLGCSLAAPGLADSVCDEGRDSVPASPASSVNSEYLA